MRTQIRGIHRLKPSGAYSAVFSFVHGYRKPSHSRDALVPAWIRCVHDVGSRTRPRTASARTPSRPSRDARSSSSTGSRARSARRRWSMCSATGGLASVTPPPERSYTARTCRSRSGRRSTSGGGRGDAKGGVVMSRCPRGSRCTGLVSPRGQPPQAQRQLAAKFFFQKDTIAPPPYVCVHAAAATILAFLHSASRSLHSGVWACSGSAPRWRSSSPPRSSSTASAPSRCYERAVPGPRCYGLAPCGHRSPNIFSFPSKIKSSNLGSPNGHEDALKHLQRVDKRRGLVLRSFGKRVDLHIAGRV